MLLALDLDGTLLTTDKRLTDRNLEAVTRAQDAGTTIVLASGRHPFSMAYFADRLHLRKRGGYLLAFNGAMLIDYPTGKVLFSQHLPQQVLPRLRDWARRYDLPLLSFRGGIDAPTIITEHPDNPYVIENARNNRMQVEGVHDIAEALASLYTSSESGAPKCLLPGDPALLPTVAENMRRDLADVIDIYSSAPHYLELVPLGIDKGRTLQRLLNIIGRTREDLIACGDQDNDISMIRFAGIGVAMGNAAAHVKEAADFVAPTCDEDGIAHIIERFILSKTQSSAH